MSISWFSYLAAEVVGKDASVKWLEAVTDEEYGILSKYIGRK